MTTVKQEENPFEVSAPRQTPHVPKTTASFHLVHMVGSVLEQRGFTGCQAGVLVELERMLEDHITNMFEQAHLLAEHANRRNPAPVDILECLSNSYLSRVDPHLFDMQTPPSPEAEVSGYESTDQREQREQRAQWAARDAKEKKVHEVVLESYEAPVREYKRFMARSRRLAGKEPDRVLVPLPLCIREASPPPLDPYTISLSDDESPPAIAGPSHSHFLPIMPFVNTDGTPSTPLPTKRRRTSTIHRLDALSQQLSTPRPLSQNKDDNPSSTSTSIPGSGDVAKGGNSRDSVREIKVRDNVKPTYMADVPWVPKLPPRHRWRKTYERQSPVEFVQTHTQLTNKTLEYLTSSVQSTASSSTLNLLPEIKRRDPDRDKSGSGSVAAMSTTMTTTMTTRHTVPLELAPVNYHTSRSSLSGSYPGETPGVSHPGTSSMPLSSGESGMMDGPLAQGAGFSSGDEIFDRVLKSGGRGMGPVTGQGQRRKRWVVGVEVARVSQIG